MQVKSGQKHSHFYLIAMYLSQGDYPSGMWCTLKDGVSWLAVAGWNISFRVSRLTGATNTIVFMQTPLKDGYRTRGGKKKGKVHPSCVKHEGHDTVTGSSSQSWRTRAGEGRGINHVGKNDSVSK